MTGAASTWSLRLLGCGPAEARLRRRVARLGLRRRVSFAPFVETPAELSRAYAEAGCVVVPGSHETFGLVAIEAAASGGGAVASSAVPSVRLAPDLIRLFAADDPASLRDAIRGAHKSVPDQLAAARLGPRLSWAEAIEAELGDLRALAR